MMALSAILAFAIYVLFYFASPFLLYYFDGNHQLPQAVEMTRILMFSIVFYSVNSYAISIFIPLKKRIIYNIGGIFSSIVYLIICGIFIYFDFTLLFAFAYAFVLSEGLTMLYYMLQLYRLKL